MPVIHLVLIILLSAVPSFALDIPLTVSDSAGVARTAEPVTSGIPFALSSNVLSVSSFGVFDGATEIPAQFTVTGRWHGAPDDISKPIRWVLVDFQANCPANSSKIYTLKTTGGSGNYTGGIGVTSSGVDWVVNTGEAEFTVSKTAFNLFKSVKIKNPLDGNSLTREVVTNNGVGPYLTRSSNGVAYYAKNNTITSVVEEQGPIRTVILIKGKYRDSGSVDLFNWIARMTFYKGKSYAKVDYTFVDVNTVTPGTNGLLKAIEGSINIDNVVLPITLAKSTDTNFIFAGDSGLLYTGNLTDTQNAFLLQTGSIDQGSSRTTGGVAETGNEGTPDAIIYSMGGQATGSGTRSRGWVDLSDGEKGVTAAVKFFWQLYPKKLEVSNSGELNIHLWPSDVADMRFYCAAQKTHEILYYFHNGSAEAADSENLINGLFGVTTSWTQGSAASRHHKLLAIAPASHYANSRAIGYVGVRDTAAYPLEHQAVVTTYYDRVDGLLDRSLRERFSGGTRGGGHEYMMWSFGDSRDATWSNLAYDSPRANALLFAATGDRKFFDHMDETAKHFRDVDVEHSILNTRNASAVNSVTTGPYLGRTKYNPSDGGQHDLGYSGRTAYGFEHYKGQGLADHYFLTGDALSKDILAETYNYVKTWKLMGGSTNQGMRAVSKPLGPILGYYQITGSASAKADADFVINIINTWQRNVETNDPLGVFWLQTNGDQNVSQVGLSMNFMMEYMKDIPAPIDITQNMVDGCSYMINPVNLFWTGNYFNDYRGGNYGISSGSVIDLMAIGGLGFCAKASGNTDFTTIGKTALYNGITQDTSNGNLKPYNQKTRYAPGFIYFLQTVNDIQPITGAVLDATPPATIATPVGGTYTNTRSVTLTRNEAGTTYYTTDGSTPTTSSTVYTGPITISSTTTLKWFSRDTAGNQETVKSATYTIQPLVPSTAYGVINASHFSGVFK